MIEKRSDWDDIKDHQLLKKLPQLQKYHKKLKEIIEDQSNDIN